MIDLGMGEGQEEDRKALLYLYIILTLQNEGSNGDRVVDSKLKMH